MRVIRCIFLIIIPLLLLFVNNNIYTSAKITYSNAKIGEKAIKVIKSYEGWYDKRYDANYPTADVDSIPPSEVSNPKYDWTIGYGHKITISDYSKFWFRRILIDEGKAILSSDVDYSINASLCGFMKKNRLNLYQRQFDALVLFTMNNNEDLWKLSGESYKTIREYIAKGKFRDKKKTKKVFMLYIKHRVGKKVVVLKGLKKRRKSEAKIFNQGIYCDVDGNVID